MKRFSLNRRTALRSLFPGPVILLFLLSSPVFPEGTASCLITRNGEALPGVKVAIKELGRSLYSDDQGQIHFAFETDGFYTFRIMIEERPVQQRHELHAGVNTLTIDVGTGTSLEEKTVIASDSIQVVGKKDQTKLSRFQLSREDIKRLPGAYGDSLKAIQTLPGISQAPSIGVAPSMSIGGIGGDNSGGPGQSVYSNATSGYLVMRGAGALSNQFLLDGFKIVYPYHLGDQSSVIHNDYIRTIDVYTGTFSAKYGNATGGIISITGPEDETKSENNINLSTFKTDVFTQQTFDEGKGTFVASARQSYPNYIMLLTYPDAIPEDSKYAEYQDGQAKIDYRIDAHNKLTLVSFGSRDIQNYTSEIDDLENDKYSSGGFSASSFLPPAGLDRFFYTTGFRHTMNYGFFRNEFSAQHTRFKELYNQNMDDFTTGETIFEFWTSNHRIETQVKDDLSFELMKGSLYLNTGVEWNRYIWELSISAATAQRTSNENSTGFLDLIDSLVQNNRTFRALWDGDRTEFSLNATYAELEWNVWRLRMTGGVRSETFSLSGDTGVGPRLGLEFAIPETSTTLLAGAGIHYGLPTDLSQISIESGNPNLEMEEAEHMAIGIEQKIGKVWTLKAEAYRNIYSNLVVSDSYILDPNALRTNRRDLVEKTEDILANPIEDDPLLYSNDGTGHSTGFEFMLKWDKKPGAVGWTGWLSYSYSETWRNNHQPRLTDDELADYNERIAGADALFQTTVGTNTLTYYNNEEWEILYDNDQEELYDLDRTHQINLVLSYTFNSEWMLGGKWTYMTQTPYTPIVGSEQAGGAILSRTLFFPTYSDDYNSERLSDYHQLDIRLDRFIRYDWGVANLYIEFINAYARQNEEEEIFNNFAPYLAGTNPTYTYYSTYYETGLGDGQRLLWPQINIGMEIKF